MPTPLPGRPAPALDVATVEGGRWTLSERSPAAFTMIVVYRGLHCPICRGYLQGLRDRLDDWTGMGFDVLAVSMNDEATARRAAQEWSLAPLTVGYGMTEDKARAWGLYLSEARNEKEPALFAEPGLFWVQADGTLWLAERANTPFVRPDLDMLLSKTGFILENGYPPRGTRAA